MSKRIHRILTLVGLGMIISSGVARADDLPMRSFNRFTYDSGTARGFWAELPVGYSHSDRDESSDYGYATSTDADVVTLAPTFAYGSKAWEAGLIVPFHQLDVKGCATYRFGGTSNTDCVKSSEGGIGDVQLYGKGVYRSEYVHIGGGLNLSLPSGDADKYLGAGEFGAAPFVTGALLLGPLELRAHVGNLFFAESDDAGYYQVDNDPYDVLLYGGGLFWPINDVVGVRGEFVGARFDAPDPFDSVTFEPGVDVRIPLGGVDLMIRPTASFGVTDESPDWGIGGGIALIEAH